MNNTFFHNAVRHCVAIELIANVKESKKFHRIGDTLIIRCLVINVLEQLSARTDGSICHFSVGRKKYGTFLRRRALIAGSNPDAPGKTVASCKVKDTINKSPVTESEGCYWRGGG